MSHWENNSSSNKSRFNNEMKFEKINKLVWDWFCIVRAKSLPISSPIILEKSLNLRTKEFGLSDLKASNGWLCRWKVWYDFKVFKVCRESASVDLFDVNNFPSKHYSEPS